MTLLNDGTEIHYESVRKSEFAFKRRLSSHRTTKRQQLYERSLLSPFLARLSATGVCVPAFFLSLREASFITRQHLATECPRAAVEPDARETPEKHGGSMRKSSFQAGFKAIGIHGDWYIQADTCPIKTQPCR